MLRRGDLKDLPPNVLMACECAEWSASYGDYFYMADDQAFEPCGHCGSDLGLFTKSVRLTPVEVSHA